VDCKAEGGFCVWWPKENLEVRHVNTIADWPADLLAKALANRDGHIMRGMGEELGAADGCAAKIPFEPTRDLQKRSKSLIRFLEHVPKGERNPSLFFCSCRFAEMVLFERMISFGFWVGLKTRR
jgi:hypothetical protein